MFEILQYEFIQRGLGAGLIAAFIAPLIGIFLVLKRYSLIADTLAHVSLAGIALGLLLKFNPVFAAIGATVLASLGIERLRTSKRIYGESALALFLSGSLALATILLSLGNGFNSGLFSYLFGSILTVTQTDVYIIAILAVIIAAIIYLFYKELLYTTFDEEVAKVSGIPTKKINTVLMVLSALAVSLSIPIVGILLIAALIVIPVVTALQFRKSFARTLIYSEIISLGSVIAGILASFYLNLSTGGTIILIMLCVFIATILLKKN